MQPGISISGIYLQGSLALDAFNPVSSDVDFVVVLAKNIDSQAIGMLRLMHRRFRRESAWGKRFEGHYVPAQDLLSSEGDFAQHYPYVAKGKLQGAHRVGPLARRLVREHGITLVGDDPDGVFAEVSDTSIRGEMRYNLNVYWRRKRDQLHLLLSDRMVDFAVTTLPRILHTLRSGSIISKPEALALLRSESSRWSPLVDDVESRLGGSSAQHRRLNRLKRAMMVREFIGVMISEGTEGN
jgi:hypothetical protein